MIARLYLLNILAVVRRVEKNLQFHLKFIAVNLFTFYKINNKKRGNKNKRLYQGYRSHSIRDRGPRVINNRTPGTPQTQYTKGGGNTKRNRNITNIKNTRNIKAQPKDTKNPMPILKIFLIDECNQNIVDSIDKYAELFLKNLQFKPEQITTTANVRYFFIKTGKP